MLGNISHQEKATRTAMAFYNTPTTKARNKDQLLIIGEEMKQLEF